MLITRQDFLRGGAALGLAAASGVSPAFAQQYPSRDIHFICGFPPGSGADIFARYFAEKFRVIAGQNVIVENRVGANSNIATEYIARSKPDGHTLYPFAGTTVAATMHLFKKPPVDVGKTIQVAATTSNLAFMLMVDPKSPYKTAQELTEAMKKKGSSASYATAANPGVIMGALYKKATGIEAVDVSYRTAPDSLPELQSGKLDFAFHDPIFALAQQREGRARILAVSSSERLQSAPDVPTMTEIGVPMGLDIWWGVMLAAGTPRPIVDRINAMFGEILKTEDARKFLALSGADPMIRTPDEAQAMFLKAIDEWGDYVKLANIPQN
ncbi:MAG TPA: tripartite tricarboxylate transporter substrate binding protein [Xanthobacteraceae bacterium]|nr:tripartite tricarboxylate transporter substrate binding protein [Xanthobacteraceae bacterium]